MNRGTTLGIFNYWAYLSERDLVDPPSLLILDDAHLAEEAAAGRYSVVIKRQDHPDQFAGLIGLIANEAAGYPVVDDLAADRPETSPHVQLIAFGDVARIVGRARTWLQEAAVSDPGVRYPLRRVGDRLDRCLWFVEPDAITIRPLRLPLLREPRFAGAGRRIYLSATLGDLQDLRRRLGTPRLVTVKSEADDAVPVPGRRLLVLVDEALDDDERLQLRGRLSRATPRRVWFCRSHREAETVLAERQEAGSTARALDRDGAVLDWFRRAPNADLVLAARYDGMDFAYDEARLAFFPSAPFGTDPLDAFLAANFPRSGFLVNRLAERLTQALGRMTRGGDWAICVIESQEFSRLLSRSDVSNLLPATLAAEIEDAWERSEGGLGATVELAEAILTGAVALPGLADWRRPPGLARRWPDDWADWEAGFGDGLDAGTYDTAIADASRLVAALGDHPLRPWWLYLKAWAEALSADHDHHVERHDEALADLGSAVRAAGPTTWFGRVAAMNNRMRGTGIPAATTRNDVIVAFCSDKTDAQLERWDRATSVALRSGRHDQVVRAWTEIGLALGFGATQPSGGGATDSRWQGSDGIYVWEAKVEQRAGSRLSRREVTQLLGQVEEERQSGQPTYAAFLTHLTEYHEDVGPIAANLAIFSLAAAEDVWEKTRAAVNSVSEARRSGHTPPAGSPPSDWLTRLLLHARGAIVLPEDVQREWGRLPRPGTR